VARAISANMLKNEGSSWKFVDCGIIVEKDRGLNEKWLEDSVSNYFLMEKGMDSVHGPWTTAPVSSLWTKDMAMAGSSSELLLPADFGHRGRT
jgi:hypothetical protein